MPFKWAIELELSVTSEGHHLLVLECGTAITVADGEYIGIEDGLFEKDSDGCRLR